MAFLKTLFGHDLTSGGFCCDLPPGKSWALGISMKKIYEKPVLKKREQLSKVVAVAISGPV